MVNSVNDIAKQARRGSVSAIIQILNEKLADSGVRTRAIFEDGILQLLCEAPTLEQLEKEALVNRIQHLLEAIAPRNIRRVKINSRIVREQQLLWLDDINRDPESQLLWSETITLARPNPLKSLAEDLKARKDDGDRPPLPKPSPLRPIRERNQFWRGILVGGIGLALLLLLWQLTQRREAVIADAPPAAPPASPAASPASPSPAPASPTPAAPPAGAGDPFAAAVRIAEANARLGQSADTPAEWLEIATRWQQASDLMKQIPAADGRYATAQDRIQLYQQYSEVALQEAQKRRGAGAAQ